ncbi:MAG: serine/threonine protein kinase [Myxococcales bacterium]|nr:serine/threonine protein kinase [Myxococcales bacterium]
MGVTEFFFQLTPEVVLHAAERAGLRPTGHCTPLTCLENRVYDVRLEDERQVVMKFYRPGRWSRAALEEEHRFLRDLVEAEVPVCAPLEITAEGGTLAVHEGLHFAVWPRTGGRSPDELRDEDIEVLGRLLARLHNVGAIRGAAARPELDAHSRVREPLELLTRKGALPPSCADRYAAAATAVADHYENLARETPLHRIHGDCHFGNLLRGRDGWFFLDFDDFAVGPAVQDIWMLLPGRDAEGRRQRALLIEAYRQFRPFDDVWLALVEPLRAMRYVWYAAWIARRFEDPAFPDAFPHFGSETYWQRETTDLEEQLAILREEKRIEEGERDGATVAGEPELTNEDFFWDL